MFRDATRTTIVAFAWLLSFLAYPRLPAQVPPHLTLAGVDTWLGRPFIAFLLPFVAVVVWALLGVIGRSDARDHGESVSSRSSGVIVTMGLLLIVTTHAVLLTTLLAGPQPWIGTLLTLSVALVILVAGNVLPRVRPNMVVGIRTPWTLRSERVWVRTHRFGGYALVLFGLGILGTLVLAPSWLGRVVGYGLGLVVVMLVLASYLFSRHEKLSLTRPALALFIVAGLVIGLQSQQGPPAPLSKEAFPELRGPYLGQTPPGADPVLFAPGIVSTAFPDSAPVCSPDGREMYWSRIAPAGKGGLFASRLENGRWSYPERLSCTPSDGVAALPSFTADGQRMLFLGNQALPDGRKPERGFFTLWITTRTSTGWSTPTALPQLFTGIEDFSVMGPDGSLYLARRDRPTPESPAAMLEVPFVNGQYGEVRALPAPEHGLPVYVAPKQRFVIFERGGSDSLGQTDLFATFRRADGTWTKGINLGPRVNTAGYEHFASFSPDGRYFFFASDRAGNLDVYWMEASFFEALERQAR